MAETKQDKELKAEQERVMKVVTLSLKLAKGLNFKQQREGVVALDVPKDEWSDIEYLIAAVVAKSGKTWQQAMEISQTELEDIVLGS